MSNTLFDQMMDRYTIQTKNDHTNALHEVTQQIALAGLYRGGFFNHAAFYGGTCLRIFHGLQRFSEDLDFSLLTPDKNFVLENYFVALTEEFNAMGRAVDIVRKDKKQQSNIESAFLKDNTSIYNLQFQTERSIKIKIEVDVLPPPDFETEPKLLLLPFSFMVNCYTLPDLYAGKMHALMFRNWNNRVKGRDWFDFEWYVRKNIPLGFKHFQQRAFQSHAFEMEEMTKDYFKTLLKERIFKTNINSVKNDVSPFINNPSQLDIWSTEYFIQLVDLIKFR